MCRLSYWRLMRLVKGLLMHNFSDSLHHADFSIATKLRSVVAWVYYLSDDSGSFCFHRSLRISHISKDQAAGLFISGWLRP